MNSLTIFKQNISTTRVGAGFGALVLSLIVACWAAPVLAQEVDIPVEEKTDKRWVAEDINSLSIFGGESGDSFLGTSELWANQWGVSAQLKQNDNQALFGLPKDSSFFNLDVKRRFGNRDKSNIELGLGWQELNINSQFDASGPRVSITGRYNFLRDFQVYGLTSYYPELEDRARQDEGTAYELEAGLMYKPLPSLSFKAGYRVFSLEVQDPVTDELGSSAGFLLGTDLSW